MDITALLEKIQMTEMEDLKLYFVAKTKMQSDASPLFRVYEMRTEDSVRSSLYLSAISKFDELLSPKEFLDFENSIEDFDVVPFDNNFPDKYFKAVISELKYSVPEMISSLSGICSKDEVCAQCIEFFDRDTEEKIFVFSKLTQNKISAKSPDVSVKVNLDPVSTKISYEKNEFVYQDSEIDGVFFRDNLLVFNKGHFEGMVERYSNIGFELSDEAYNC